MPDKKYYYNLTIEDSRVVRDKTNFSYKQRCKKEFWEHQFYIGSIIYKGMLTFKVISSKATQLI